MLLQDGMNILHIAVLNDGKDNPDMIKLLLHFGVDHQVCCLYNQVTSYIVN
jgi:ankyrin repeat protein